MSFCSMKTNTLKLSLQFLTAAGLATITACGGGGTIAGVEGTGGSQQGDVSGFGSIIVNGQRIDVSNAEIVINGVASSEAELKVGHIVTVETAADGSARRVTANRQVDGPLESVDLALGTAQALNQPIRVTATTRYENTNFSSNDDSSRGELNPADNDLIAVSGFIDADGVLVATLFRRSSQSYNRSSSVFDVDGSVSQLNTTTNEFMLGDLTVSYSSSNVIGELAEGVNVEVVGMQAEENGPLNASSVTTLPAASDNNGDPVSLTGYVSEAGNELQFTVNGVSVDASTAMRRDNSSEMLMRNSFVRVVGNRREDGGITAREFTLVPASSASYHGNAVINDGGDVQLYGITAETSLSTIYQDNSPTALRSFNADSINSGDKLNVAGYFDRNNQFVASLVERLPMSSSDSVRGTVMSCRPTANSAMIGNVVINVDSNTKYRDQQGNQRPSMESFCSEAMELTATATGTTTGLELTAILIKLSR